MKHTARRRAVSGAVLAACLAATAACSGSGSGAGEPAVATSPAASPKAPLPSQVGKSLPAALEAAVQARFGYGLSEANGGGQLERVTPQQWKVCFQKAGPLSDSVIFGVVRTHETCPDRWIDKLASPTS
ncbi:hypothetical protein ACFYRY_37100 [Streptomyces sp. NPDC005263]|uniref:hypothetical protein n=1 Tax=Streptomyces sp. NPDC005263 TaxID=3364711 RepID=UPI00368A2439